MPTEQELLRQVEELSRRVKEAERDTGAQRIRAATGAECSSEILKEMLTEMEK